MSVLIIGLVILAVVIVGFTIKNKKSKGSNPIPNHGGTGSTNNLGDQQQGDGNLTSADGGPIKPPKDPIRINPGFADIDEDNPKPPLGVIDAGPKPLPTKPVKPENPTLPPVKPMKIKKGHPGRKK
jgi:hypothetical protein|tara:strand:- start:2708 stop:3085 length:378 start_codon:yes stop_codon:yes gene_type:complete